MKKTKTLRMKQGKNNPLLNGLYIPLLIFFIFVTVAMTIKPIAEKIGKAIGVSTGDVLWTGKVVSSILVGILLVLLASSFVGIPLFAGMLALTGVIGVGWGVYDITKRYPTNVGDTNSPR